MTLASADLDRWVAETGTALSGWRPRSRPADPPARRPSATTDWLRALERTAPIGRDPRRTLPRVIAEVAADRGEAPALIGEDETLTYRALAERMEAYAEWAREQGLPGGGVVALLMPNRPDYLAAWLGITAVGGVVALLNTNLRGRALAHCLAVSGARRAIVDASLLDAFEEAAGELPTGINVWVGDPATQGGRPGRAAAQDRTPSVAPAGLRRVGPGFGPPVQPGMTSRADIQPPASVGRGETGPSLADTALLIFTSGTTGLPKAARVSHHRLMSWSHWFAGLMDAGPSDRIYDCLPLYHSVGGVVATGALLVSGGSVVLRERFSASRFWPDVVGQGCTLVQYIGELCRYLVLAPPHPLERAHRLRLCAGNGLRPDIWERFRDRFAIPRILEFYAATEGTLSLYNVEGKVGAVGRVPAFMSHRSPAALIRHDVATGEPARGPDGLCLRAAPGEVGELLGRLAEADGRPEHRFEGYTGAAEGDRKVLRDVLAPGDAWFRTGDLMRQDEGGFFHFMDRIGDTFRWKGENVATTEVAEALSGVPGVTGIAVYGVAVPGHEGRAGMAALSVEPGFDLATFRDEAARRLPPYARPVFLRVTDGIALTETFKQRKADLAALGFDPSGTEDRLFFDDRAAGSYRALDPALHAAILSGEVRP